MTSDNGKDAVPARRVSNMTPSEVRRKRELDRENQRHFRNKRKSHIENLEQQVVHLKRGLEQTRELLRICSRCAVCGSSLPANPPSLDPQPLHNTVELLHDTSQIPEPWDTRQANLPVYLSSGFAFNQGQLQSLDLGLGDIIALPSDEEASTVDGHLSAPAENKKPWEVMPVHVAPSSRLDHTIHRISSTARQLHAKHQFGDELSQPAFPSISSLLNHSGDQDETRPISAAVATHVGYSPVDSTTGRIAFMYVLSHLLRWLICRTEESYNQLPNYMKPTRLQCLVPHPAWVDTVIWPGMRDTIIQKMDWGQFEHFRLVCSKSMSVNWKYPDSGAFVESADGQNLLLHPLFEAHIRKIENWSIGPEIGHEFPILAPWCSGS